MVLILACKKIPELLGIEITHTFLIKDDFSHRD
jgi:hypothetical protein